MCGPFFSSRYSLSSFFFSRHLFLAPIYNKNWIIFVHTWANDIVSFLLCTSAIMSRCDVMWCIFVKLLLCNWGGEPFCRAHRKTLFSGRPVNGNSKSINVWVWCEPIVRWCCAVISIIMNIIIVIILWLPETSQWAMCVLSVNMHGVDTRFRRSEPCARALSLQWKQSTDSYPVYKNLIYLDKINRFI